VIRFLRGMVSFYAVLFGIDDAVERARARISYH
jgi:hypothetical protein